MKIELPKPTHKQVDIRDLIVDDSVNIRFSAGQNVHGLAIEGGSYDTDTMVMEIIQAGRIHTPLTVSLRDDGKMYVLTGNRRTRGGKKVADNPDPALKEVKDELKKVPTLVYKGLTREQEQFIVNDQNTKGFKKSELTQFFWRLQDEGWTYNDIVEAFWQQLSQFTGADDKRAEVERMGNNEERLKTIKTWFRTTVEYGILLAGRLGERVRRIFLAQLLIKDGLLKKENAGEFFKTNAENLKKLRDAQKAEEAMWNPDTGSPMFNELIDALIEEAKVGPAGAVLKRPSVTQLGDFALNMRSDSAKSALRWAQGHDIPDLKIKDMTAKRNEDVNETIAKLVNDIQDPQVANLLRLIAFGKDIVELEAALKTFIDPNGSSVASPQTSSSTNG